MVRALVSEDDPGIRRLIVGLLARGGWDVREAGEDDEAVDDGTAVEGDEGR